MEQLGDGFQPTLQRTFSTIVFQLALTSCLAGSHDKQINFVHKFYFLLAIRIVVVKDCFEERKAFLIEVLADEPLIAAKKSVALLKILCEDLRLKRECLNLGHI